MADRTLTLGVQTDEATIAAAKKRLAELERAQAKLAAAQSKYAGDSSKAGKAIQDGITKQSKELTLEQKRLERALQNSNKALIDQQSAANRAAKGVEAAKATAAAGRPAVPEVLTSADRLRQVGRDIRGLPSVQVPGLGVGTDTFGRAAEVMGRLGIGVKELAVGAGVATIAIGAVAIAFKVFVGDMAQAQADIINATVEANRKVGQDIAAGLTTEGANKRLEEINRLRQQENEVLGQTKEELENTQQALQPFASGGLGQVVGGAFEDIGNRILNLIPGMGALDSQVDKSGVNLETLATEEAALNAAREDGTLAANDAASAEKALAEARVASILEEASQAGELASLKARAADLTQEQIDSELESLAIRKAGLEAELAALESSGDKSEEVSKQIDKLRESLSFLGEQSDVLKTARTTARSSEAEKAKEKAAKEAEKAETDRLKSVEKAQNDAAKAQENYTNAIEGANQKFADATADIGRNLIDKFADINRGFDDDMLADSIKFNQDELKEERQFQRELARTRRESERAEKDAIRQRDFAAAADAQQRGQDAINDRIEAEQAENAEQLLEFQQGRQERARERDIERREAQIDAQRARRDAGIARDRSIRDSQATYRDALQLQSNFGTAFLGGFKNIFDNVLKMQSQMGGGTNRSGTSPSTNNSSNPSSFEDMLQYVVAPGG